MLWISVLISLPSLPRIKDIRASKRTGAQHAFPPPSACARRSLPEVFRKEPGISPDVTAQLCFSFEAMDASDFHISVG